MCVTHPVDPAAVLTVGGAGAETEHPIDDGAADCDAALVARVAVLCRSNLGARIPTVAVEARLWHQEPQGSPLGALAEQRALRTAEYLDTLDVKQLREHVVGAEADVTTLHRCIVNVDGGGRCAGSGVDAANVDVGVLVVVVGRIANTGAGERQVRSEACQVIDILESFRVDLLLREGGDTDRNVLQPLLAAGRRDEDLLQAAAL